MKLNYVVSAGFALWDDHNNTYLQSWIDSVDFTLKEFPEPNYWVFGGKLTFSYDDWSQFTVCLNKQSGKTWCVVENDGTKVFEDPQDAP